MRSLLAAALVILMLLTSIGGCTAATPTKRTVVNVAALMFPGGGAPPSVVALYKAALEVNRAAEDFEIRISSVSPQMPEPVGIGDHPETRPGVTALEQALGQDPPPDAVLFSSLSEFGVALEKDLLQPLDSYYRADRNIKPDDYYPGAVEALRDNDRLYALPVTVAPTVLMYDMRLFDEAGLELPEPDWNWNTFLGYAKRLTKAKGDPRTDQYAINLVTGMILPAFIWQNGGELVSKDGKRSLIMEPAAAEAIQFYYDLVHTYKVVPPNKLGGSAQTVMPDRRVVEGSSRVGLGEVPPLTSPAGRVAITLMPLAGSTQVAYAPYLQGGQDRPIRLAELPRNKMPATIIDVLTAIGMTARAANPQTAYRAMTALANEMQKELSVPARRSLAKNLRQINPNITEEDTQVILNSLEYGRPLILARNAGAMQVLYQKLQGPIMQGSKPVDEILKEASDALDEVLNK